MVCKAIEDIFNQQYDIISKKSGEVGGWVFMINENAGKKSTKKGVQGIQETELLL